MSACLVPQSCLALCIPMDCRPLGSSLHGILQARILERVAMPSSRDFPNPGIKLLHWEHRVLATGPPGKSLGFGSFFAVKWDKDIPF